MLTLFLEWGEGLAKLSRKLYNRLRRKVRPHKDERFVVELEYPAVVTEGKRAGTPRLEVLEVSARSKRGAETKILNAEKVRLSLSGPFLKRGLPRVISIEVKKHK